MDPTVYESLQRDFILIRNACSDGAADDTLLCEAAARVNSVRAELKTQKGRNHKILYYAADTLLKLLKEKDRPKAAAFAALVCDMPEIGMGKRRFSSFYKDIRRFRKQYGKEYFARFDRSVSAAVIGTLSVLLIPYLYLFYYLWTFLILVGLCFLVFGCQTPPVWLIVIALLPSCFPLALGVFSFVYSLIHCRKRYAIVGLLLSLLNLVINGAWFTVTWLIGQTGV